MAMSSEQELPQPLDGEEIKNAIVYKVSDAIRDVLDKRCALYGKAYPKFKATVRIEFTLDDFGRIVQGAGDAEVSEGELTTGSEAEEILVDIPETPPNVLRRDTEQPVPTMVTKNGVQREQKITYAPKKRGRPAKAK
jgi:hypothetical protein